MPSGGWRNDYWRDAAGRLRRVHIRPVKDLKPHPQSAECWCRPRQERHEGAVLVIHNAADGRDLVEKHGVQ